MFHMKEEIYSLPISQPPQVGGSQQKTAQANYSPGDFLF
jgi:hypothetical protein